MRPFLADTRVLLLAVAFTAVCLALCVSASREIAAPGVGIGLIVFSAVGLVLSGMVEGIGRCRAGRPPATAVRVAVLFLNATLVAAFILTISDLSFLIVHELVRAFFGYRIMERGEPLPLYGPGILAGAVVAGLVASGLRRFLWGGPSSGGVGTAHHPGPSPETVGDAHPTETDPGSAGMANLDNTPGTQGSGRG